MNFKGYFISTTTTDECFSKLSVGSKKDEFKIIERQRQRKEIRG